MKKGILAALLVASIGAAGCKSGISKSARSEFNNALEKVQEIERRLAEPTGDSDINELLSDISELYYDFNPMDMDSSYARTCQDLKDRISNIKEHAVSELEGSVVGSQVTVKSENDILLEGVAVFPVYLERGEMLYYSVKLQKPGDIKLYNVDTKSLLRTHASKAMVNDSLEIKNKGIYLVEISPKSSQYADVNIFHSVASLDHYLNPRSVKMETVSCSVGDFRAHAVKGVSMKNIFENPYKSTLRSQLKSMFSGSSRAVIPIKIPAGTTDILYTLRISTSESDKYSDGKWNDNLQTSYKKIKFLGLPVYESAKGAGILSTLLDDNRPIREEDAYCNMYLFTSSSQAKAFQDNTKMASQLSYDVDYSSLGTQSCNGRIPARGMKTIYVGVENERVRYTNYIWFEAVASVPCTEYFNETFTLAVQ